MKITKTIREALRRELGAKEYSPPDIALVMAARYGVRPRLALRWAYGMTLDDVAEAWNQRDGSGRAPMSGRRVCDYERWPDGGKRPTAYALLMLAKIYAVPVERLVDRRDFGALGDKQLFEVVELCRNRAAQSEQAQAATDTAAREAKETATRRQVVQLGGLAVAAPVLTPTTPEQVIAAAAEESADLAAWAGASNVDDDALEQLSRSMRAIAHDYVHSPPYPLLQRTHRLRTQVWTLLRGHQRPTQTRELFLLGARLCTLLAWMSGDLGDNRAAGDHAWAAWRCAERADHNGARTWVRAVQSKTAFWDGDYEESARLARDGLRYTPSDSAAVHLALLEARAWGQISRVDEADSALDRWRTEREQVPGPDEVGGVLGASLARQHYLAGSAYLCLQRPDQALAESHQAIDLFEATPDAQRFYGPEMMARIDAGLAQVRSGRLDGAVHVLQPVLAVGPEQRLATIVQSLGRVRAGLALPAYRGSAAARQLQDQIEEYRAQPVGAHLAAR
ncbi:MAG: hypothetical protein ACRDYA_03055 [Egibacteraceae bacterium]